MGKSFEQTLAEWARQYSFVEQVKRETDFWSRFRDGNRRGRGVWFDRVSTIITTPRVPSNERNALVDIAYDCGSLEAAQKRAMDALKEVRR